MANNTSVLSKLDQALGKNRQQSKEGRVDFKEIAELKKKVLLKLKDGKNEVVFVNPSGAQDPFSLWAIHKGLQEVAYYSIPCDKENKNEECGVCKNVKDLQDEDFMKNKSIWKPIQQEFEYYATVVNVESEATIAEGIKWLRLSKSVMSQLREWIVNLDKDEEPFYSDEEPVKIIIKYDKTAAPMEQYKLDKKAFKGFKPDQLSNWRENVVSIAAFNPSKSAADVAKLLDGYYSRIQDDVTTETTETSDAPKETVIESVSTGKLNFLKK